MATCCCHDGPCYAAYRAWYANDTRRNVGGAWEFDDRYTEALEALRAKPADRMAVIRQEVLEEFYLYACDDFLTTIGSR